MKASSMADEDTFIEKRFFTASIINLLVHFNPNAQFFITTHSPALFGDGWGDKVWYMEQITK